MAKPLKTTSQIAGRYQNNNKFVVHLRFVRIKLINAVLDLQHLSSASISDEQIKSILLKLTDFVIFFFRIS